MKCAFTSDILTVCVLLKGLNGLIYVLKTRFSGCNSVEFSVHLLPNLKKTRFSGPCLENKCRKVIWPYLSFHF